VQVIETRKMVLGPEHPSTLMSMQNLVSILKTVARNFKAIPLLQKCVGLLMAFHIVMSCNLSRSSYPGSNLGQSALRIAI
jgi:hypothetical protein